MRGILSFTLTGILLLCLGVSATEIPAGPVSGDWYASGNPYNVNGEIYILMDSTLNIHPGVQVVFQGHYKFIVNGILEANGVQGDSILFTATDTSIGWHGLRFVSAQDSSRLSYCIIQYGKATGIDPDNWGGGIYCYGSNIIVSHCVIENNSAPGGPGGGILVDVASLDISNCRIANNTGYSTGGGIAAQSSIVAISGCEISGNSTYAEQTWGGGGLCFYECEVNLTQCTVTDNQALNWVGGGITVARFCDFTMSDCEIAFNTAYQGGGMHIQECDATLTDCDIHDNYANATSVTGGGGIFVASFNSIMNIVLSNCTITGNQSNNVAGGIYIYNWGSQIIGSLRNCVIASNYSESWGGGIYAYYSDQLSIDQCTISENYSGSLGVEVFIKNASPTIGNTIVEGSSGNSSIFFDNAPNTSISYCDVYNNAGPNFGGSVPPGLGDLVGVNGCGDSCDVYMNIFMDPLFRDPASGDYHLQSMTNPQCGDPDDSPCIDAGDPIIEDIVLDCDWGLGTIISDMGAHGGGDSTMLEIRDFTPTIPQRHFLFQNNPNPFNAQTTIRYSLSRPSDVTIEIYDLLGRKVETLVKEEKQAGQHRAVWDASRYSSGMYLYRIQAGEYIETKKMLLLK